MPGGYLLQEKAKGNRLQAEATLATARSAAATELQQREAQLHAESAALTRKMLLQQQPGSSLGALLAGEVQEGGGRLPLPPMMGSPAGSAADFNHASVGAAEVDGGEGGRMSGGENVAAGVGLGVELDEMRAAAEALKAKVTRGVQAGRGRHRLAHSLSRISFDRICACALAVKKRMESGRGPSGRTLSSTPVVHTPHFCLHSGGEPDDAASTREGRGSELAREVGGGGDQDRRGQARVHAGTVLLL